MMTQIIELYRASNLDVRIVFGLEDLDDERYRAIKTALGIDPSRVSIEGALPATDKRPDYYEIKRYTLTSSQMSDETASAE